MGVCVCVPGWEVWLWFFFSERRKKRRRSRRRDGEGAPGGHSGGQRAPAGSEVGGGLGGERLDAAGVAVFAEDVSVQGVASLVVPL